MVADPEQGAPAAAPPPARILVVDDEAAQMNALCDTLREHGYETTGFSAAGQALAALRETKFDLLLADLMMPEMDGIALLRAAIQADADLVGIIMTGEGTIATAVAAMKVGALDYILKPFKLSAILPVLSRALAMRQLRMENADLERRLREQAVRLEAANRELEAFSSSVSHDLRGPLRTINNYSGILKEDFAAQLPAEAVRLLDNVAAGARRMDQLIEDLLRFSRLGRQPLAKKTVDVGKLVREVLDELHEQQRDRKVEIKLEDLPARVADPSLIRQVFVNLLSNALKFTRNREHASVEIGSRRQDGERVFFVKDNGAGFDMRHANKLFGVFQRLHSDKQFEGTGIGLSLVQRIVERHGGRVWAEAEKDRGATFYFTLPDPPAAL